MRSYRKASSHRHQHQPPSSGSLSGGPVPRPTLLFQRLGSGVGRQSPRPICLGSFVDRGAHSLHKPMRTSSKTYGAPSFPPLSEGLGSGSVYRQHHSPVLCQETRRYIFHGARLGGATSPSVGRIARSDSGSPLYCGVPEYGSRLLEPLSTGPRFRVNPGLGGSGRVGNEVAGDC